MAIVSSVSGVQNALQPGLQQLRLQQAQRNADQAEQTARALRAEADAAQRGAARADERARSLDVDATQAQGRAGEARQGVAAMKSLGEFGMRLTESYGRVADAQASAETQTKPPDPVVNTQGQVTGQLVNVAA